MRHISQVEKKSVENTLLHFRLKGGNYTPPQALTLPYITSGVIGGTRTATVSEDI